MPSERVALRREQETMLMTLYLHARDADSKHPVLGDRYAAPVLNRIDYDFKRLKSLSGNQPVIVARAKAIDNIARAFLERHEEAVVLHLGCGLDSRVERLDPGPGVAWYDVDQQPVIDLRRRLIDTSWDDDARHIRHRHLVVVGDPRRQADTCRWRRAADVHLPRRRRH